MSIEWRIDCGIFSIDYHSTTDSKHQNLIDAFGPGLQQAQVGVPTSFTVDGHRAVNSDEDIKVLVTSKNKSYEKSFSFTVI